VKRTVSSVVLLTVQAAPDGGRARARAPGSKARNAGRPEDHRSSEHPENSRKICVSMVLSQVREGIGGVCKTVGSVCVGSNLTPATSKTPGHSVAGVV
jgi:hypothetical protein